MCKKLLEFHNIDITTQIAQDFLTLRTVFSDFNETELLAKYPPELAEKLIFNNNNIQVLEKQNNNNFAFTINHHLYITKCLFLLIATNATLPSIACVLRVYYASDF